MLKIPWKSSRKPSPKQDIPWYCHSNHVSGPTIYKQQNATYITFYRLDPTQYLLDSRMQGTNIKGSQQSLAITGLLKDFDMAYNFLGYLTDS